MSWDEHLFGKLLGVLRRVGQRDERAAAARGVDVVAAVPRLELVASAVAGRRLAIVVALGDGGLRGDTIVLPPRIASLATVDDNAALVLGRVAIAALWARDRPAVDGGDDARAVATAIALARIRAGLAAELPGAERMLAARWPALRALRPAVTARTGADQALEAALQVALGAAIAPLVAAAPGLDGRWLAAVAAGGDAAVPGPARGGRAPAIPIVGWLGAGGVDGGAAIAAAGASARPPRGGHERAGRARDRVRRRALDESATGDNPLIHSFEKVHTLEKYQGGRKRVDGDDDLGQHGDALDELELDEVVRSSTGAASVYHAEVLGLDGAGDLTDAPPAAPATLAYDEWDVAARRYRRGWCLVNVDDAPPAAGAAPTRQFVRAALARHRRERTELAAQIARLDAAPRRLGRQPDGPEVDIDAVVERHGALRRGTTGPEKLHVAHRRGPPGLAVALLIDRSLSSDSWVAGQRVLDVGAGALVALGDALDRAAARTAIVGFCSHTRRDCRLAVVKGFAAPWCASHPRLAALEPSGYTRIGPALRHVTVMLEREPARRKLLVLLSDGKPTDYDRYEGRHGVADVRKAVDEAARRGVHVFALGLDPRVRHHLPAMFGPGGFAVLARPRDLVSAIGRLYQQRLLR